MYYYVLLLLLLLLYYYYVLDYYVQMYYGNKNVKFITSLDIKNIFFTKARFFIYKDNYVYTLSMESYSVNELIYMNSVIQISVITV